MFTFLCFILQNSFVPFFFQNVEYEPVFTGLDIYTCIVYCIMIYCHPANINKNIGSFLDIDE